MGSSELIPSFCLLVYAGFFTYETVLIWRREASTSALLMFSSSHCGKSGGYSRGKAGGYLVSSWGQPTTRRKVQIKKSWAQKKKMVRMTERRGLQGVQFLHLLNPILPKAERDRLHGGRQRNT